MHESRASDRAGFSIGLPWLLLAIVIFGIGVYTFRGRIADILKPPVPVVQSPSIAAPAATAVGMVVTSSSVLQKIGQVNRLESVEMKISTVVTAKKEGTAWKLWQDSQTAVLIGEGTVSAGVDLSNLKSSDIIVSADGKTVRIQLPAAEILATNLQQTETYDIKTGLFGTVNIDQHLLDQARSEARVKLQTTACKANVLQQATESSKHQMENLITMMGLEAEITSTPAAPCPANVVE